MTEAIIAIVVVVVLLLFMIVLTVAVRYKTCPPDKIMIIYGKLKASSDGTYHSAKCLHGGAAFVWPFLQKYTFMDLTPLSISVDLKNALSKQNIRIDVPSIFTVGISTDAGVMQNAAERLGMLKMSEISDLARDIIFGQLRLVIATMNIEEINSDRDKFLEAISRNVEGELKKVGLRLINVNVTDITDESGYITALGKEAAAKAINDARVSVAEEDKKGAIGQANAKMEERIRVAEAESAAIDGENKAKAEIARSQAVLREKEAEALKLAVAAEKVQAAKALEESYSAEQSAEVARAAREKATKEADIIVAADIEKRKLESRTDQKKGKGRGRRNILQDGRGGARRTRKAYQAGRRYGCTCKERGNCARCGAPAHSRQTGNDSSRTGQGHFRREDRQGYRMGRRPGHRRKDVHRKLFIGTFEVAPSARRNLQYGGALPSQNSFPC